MELFSVPDRWRPSAPRIPKRNGNVRNPANIRMTPVPRLNKTDWVAISLAASKLSAPNAFETSAVAPCDMPALTAMRMKKTGKDTDKAAKAFTDNNPAK